MNDSSYNSKMLGGMLKQNKLRYRILFVITLFVSLVANAQYNTISNYIDDGGRSTTKNLIKIDLPEYLRSNISIIWEHRFNSALSLQTGVGALINGLIRPIYIPRYNVNDKTMNENLNNGFSLIIAPTFYKEGFESFHLELPFKYHYYFGQAVSYEFNCTVGRQWFLSRRISLDIDLGIGIGFEKSLDGISYIYDSEINNVNYASSGMRLIFPFSIKFGYIL